MTFDDTLAVALARLQGSPSLLPNDNVVRSHLTPVTRDEAPAVHLIEGDHAKPVIRNQCADREAEFMVRIVVRGDDDAAKTVAYGYAAEVLSRLNPQHGAAYPAGVVLSEGPIEFDNEAADGDVIALDMHFGIKYSNTAWSL